MIIQVVTGLQTRRYKRAAGFLIFVVSLCGFLVYRTEYLKLRYTFEVGGLLNPPPPPSDCLVLNASTRIRHDEYSSFSKPRPSWRIINDFHVYSAFVHKVGNSVIAVALGLGKSKEDCKLYKCHLWSTKGGVKFSSDGIFSCESFGDTHFNTTLLEFYCEVKSTSFQGEPYIFVFIDEANRKHLVPLHNGSMKTSDDKRSALCVFPDSFGLEQLSIVEFISYHQLIGFTDIIVYDNSLHHGIFDSLEHIFETIDYVKSFSVLMWNYPFTDINFVEEIIKRDCLYRTQGRIDLVLVLGWNDFLIPVKNYTILPILKKLEKEKTTVLSVVIQKCCTNRRGSIGSEKSWPIIFKKTNCIAPNNDSFLSFKPKQLLPSVNLLHVPQSEIYISRYDICYDSDNAIIEDKRPLKFLVKLMKNKLLRIWRSGSLFDS